MFDLEHVRRLVVDRKVVFLWDGTVSDAVQVTPTVFFDTDHDDPSAERFVPDALLDERFRRLHAGLGTREWYLVTEEPLASEWTEVLRGDYGVLIVSVESLVEARRVLGAV